MKMFDAFDNLQQIFYFAQKVIKILFQCLSKNANNLARSTHK